MVGWLFGLFFYVGCCRCWVRVLFLYVVWLLLVCVFSFLSLNVFEKFVSEIWMDIEKIVSGDWKDRRKLLLVGGKNVILLNCSSKFSNIVICNNLKKKIYLVS